MSIALVAHYLGPTLGIGQYLDRLLPPLVAQLQDQKIESIILGSPNAVAKTPALKTLDSTLEILPALDDSPTKRLFWFATAFPNYCRQQGITGVVWLSNPIVLPWHPPSIAVLHDVNEWKMGAKYGSYWKTALRSLIYLDSSLRSARKIVAISQATYDDIAHFRPDPKLKQKLITIANGANSSLVDQAPVEIPAPEVPFLLSVGRIDPSSKNLPEALHLTEALRHASGEPWEIHLIGGMNESTQEAGEAFINSLEAYPWATYHGYLDNQYLAQWYRQATAIAFLSNHEGFGFPIAEAASFQRWSIVSDQNQAAFEAGGNALIPINIQNPQKSVNLVLEKLQQPQPPAVELQTWETSAQMYAQLIQEVLT